MIIFQKKRKKEIADMNIVDTYQRTGVFKDSRRSRVVKSKDEHLLLWNNLARYTLSWATNRRNKFIQILEKKMIYVHIW
ncbi:MAG: hypothetical protein ACLUZ6_02085 [Lachnospira eligens]